ncbi:MAG: bifunctional glycoside hydrolase 114/ polysaccharide deacetylase family protein [Propionivibrio sp.]|nr:bifunctional glycoside hydrolase 114/ polysaccharide deacetylase family protein [Propionivibrio sp.]
MNCFVAGNHASRTTGFVRWLLRCVLSACLLGWLPSAQAVSTSVALHYGADAPLEELKAFDIVVVEPDHGFDPKRYKKSYSELFAYIAIGEVQPSRAYAAAIPAKRLLTTNADWGSKVIDLSWPELPTFVAEAIVGPLWERGYRGFFLDTLDSYRLASGVDEAAQQKGLIAVIKTLHRRFPGIRLILNRGFEIVPAVRDKITMVAAESLFRGWNATSRRYVEVSAADREWLLGQLRRVRDEFGVPVLAIDYLPPQARGQMRETAARIRALGIEPWVTDSQIGTVGIGRREIVPRRMLMLYDGSPDGLLIEHPAMRFGAMPIQHLGYTIDFHDLRKPLPAGPLAARYAGIVIWANAPIARGRQVADWLQQQIDQGLKVAVFGSFPFAAEGKLAHRLGLKSVVASGTPGRLTVASQDAMIGFEAPPQPDRRNLTPLQLADGHGRSLLKLADTRGQTFDVAALTRWGGYVLDPYAVVGVPGSEQSRWIIDPFAFLQQALALPDLPLPDTTTENGRRLMFIHIDGDGYPSRAELPGTPLAGEALLTQVLQRYRLPTTMSVIEGEVAPDGLYPALSAEMEAIARRTFALPYIEIASHTYSHPFDWSRAELAAPKKKGDDSYHLEIPGYEMNLEREIVGSVDYIRKNLAPPGKPVRIMLWSGDAAPQAQALRIAEDAGLLNMNGGNTIITRSFPSLTAVSPLGYAIDGIFQTFAPVMNENVYTNLWHGPYYGFERVIETFQMTDSPRRLKPIDIYYHTYSASKQASLKALYKVYDWSLAQSPNLIHASDFIRKALDFETMVLAREDGGWRIRGNGELRTLRAPVAMGYPERPVSGGVAGYLAGNEGNYIHLASGDTLLRFAATRTGAVYLVDANARLTDWQSHEAGQRFSLKGYQAIEFSLANASHCSVLANGRTLTPRKRSGSVQTFGINDATATIETRCRDR